MRYKPPGLVTMNQGLRPAESHRAVAQSTLWAPLALTLAPGLDTPIPQALRASTPWEAARACALAAEAPWKER